MLAQLRAATRAPHHRIDHHPLLGGLVRPGLSEAGYAAALAALHGPQQRFESLAVAAWREAGFVLSPRLADLEADLADLGRAPGPMSDVLANLPAPADEAEALALVYVLEGSRMGARVIGRELARHHPDWPRRFFAPDDAAEGAARWAAFSALAEGVEAEMGQTRAADYAVRVFNALLGHLDVVGTDACA